MPVVQIRNHSIYYEDRGQGMPLVLISGLGTSRLFWWKQVDALSRRFRTVIFDNRGIGDSSRAEARFSIADMADDANALIQALELGPSFVLGISMGGFIAATLALRHPEHVRKLILSSTSAGGHSHAAAEDEIRQILLSSDGSDVEAYTRRIYTAIAGPGHMQRHPEDLNRIIRNVLEKPLSPETYLYQLNAINEYMGEAGVDTLLDRITMPTLLIHGDQDPLVPYPNAQYLAAHIQGARLLTYAGVGHLPPIEAADQFNADVADFLGPADKESQL